RPFARRSCLVARSREASGKNRRVDYDRVSDCGSAGRALGPVSPERRRAEDCCPRRGRSNVLESRRDVMAQFVFLYRQAEEAAAGAEQMQEAMRKWMAWFKELSDNGHLKDRGLPLDRIAGAVVAGTPKRNVTDGPYAEKDLVMGFSLIEANDLAEACRLAAECPHFDQGGSVEEGAGLPNLRRNHLSTPFRAESGSHSDGQSPLI